MRQFANMEPHIIKARIKMKRGVNFMRELDRVIGYEGIKQELYRIIDIVKNPAKYKKLGVSVPKGILLSGEPGIGKTLMAKCFIKETGLKTFVIRKDKPDGDFIDFIRDTFDKAAKAAPCIVLLDDIDKFANEDEYHPNGEEYVTVQACIDDVKDSEVIAIATCNDFDKLPESLVRAGRFDKCFFMNFPEINDAKKIIAFYLKNKKVGKDVDVEEIARFMEDHSCADLELVINEAGISAGYENKKCISQEDIKKAVINKIFGGRENVESNPESDRRLAVHEAGHAALSELLFPGQVAFISIATRNHGVRGLVKKNKPSHLRDSFENIEADIMISLAGKAATEIILNEIDMGSRADLRKANDDMRRLLDDVAALDFHAWCHGPQTSSNVFDHLDNAVGTELSRYYLKTKQMLGRNRSFLEAIIEKLLEKKTLSYKDIAPIREKFVAGGNKAA